MNIETPYINDESRLAKSLLLWLIYVRAFEKAFGHSFGVHLVNAAKEYSLKDFYYKESINLETLRDLYGHQCEAGRLLLFCGEANDYYFECYKRLDPQSDLRDIYKNQGCDETDSLHIDPDTDFALWVLRCKEDGCADGVRGLIEDVDKEIETRYAHYYESTLLPLAEECLNILADALNALPLLDHELDVPVKYRNSISLFDMLSLTKEKGIDCLDDLLQAYENGRSIHRPLEVLMERDTEIDIFIHDGFTRCDLFEDLFNALPNEAKTTLDSVYSRMVEVSRKLNAIDKAVIVSRLSSNRF